MGRTEGQECQLGTGKHRAVLAMKRGTETVAGAAARGKGNFLLREGVKCFA